MLVIIKLTAVVRDKKATGNRVRGSDMSMGNGAHQKLLKYESVKGPSRYHVTRISRFLTPPPQGQNFLACGGLKLKDTILCDSPNTVRDKARRRREKKVSRVPKAFSEGKTTSKYIDRVVGDPHPPTVSP